MRVLVRGGLKMPIKGVAFSNQDVGIEVEDEEVAREDWAAVRKLMEEHRKQLVEEYIGLLQQELQDSQSDLLEKLGVKLAEEYESKLDEARKEIIKLKGEK